MSENSENEPQEEAPASRNDILMRGVIVVLVALFAYFRWDIFKTALIFAVTLGVLVAIHEWGHFIAAKAVGVRVYEFALGFGPRLITYMRRGDTDYTIRAFPIGGFVNAKGMQPDDPITSDGINGRRPAERALVYLAGPLMNVILGTAVFLLMGSLVGTQDEHKVLVAEVTRGAPAGRMMLVERDGKAVPPQPGALESGDVVRAIDGRPVNRLEDVVARIWPRAGKTVRVEVHRGAQDLVLSGTPKGTTLSQRFLTVTQVPSGTALGVRVGDQVDEINGDEPGSAKEPPDVAASRLLREEAGKPVTLTVWRDNQPLEITGAAAPVLFGWQFGKRTVGQLGFHPTLGEGPRVSLKESALAGKEMILVFTENLLAMFRAPKQASENVGGPVAIWGVLGKVSGLPAFNYCNILAQLSLSLAFFNLLPIPILDGGHITLLAVEVLRRRRLEPDAQKVFFLVGLAIIGILSVLITAHDFLRPG